MVAEVAINSMQNKMQKIHDITRFSHSKNRLTYSVYKVIIIQAENTDLTEICDIEEKCWEACREWGKSSKTNNVSNSRVEICST